MRVVVAGATGNLGTSLLQALEREHGVESVLGIARRLPQLEFERTEWARADITHDDLVRLFRGADAVVHLAWLIQPSRDLATLRATNITGTNRLLDAVRAARVPNLVYASSVGTYSRGPKDRRVDEGWPTDGIQTSFYSRHKAEVERMLDRFEREAPDTRRPASSRTHFQARGRVGDSAPLRRPAPSGVPIAARADPVRPEGRSALLPSRALARRR
jgi:nucleoside-diphosphate-sugar epimerase